MEIILFDFINMALVFAFVTATGLIAVTVFFALATTLQLVEIVYQKFREEWYN